MEPASLTAAVAVVGSSGGGGGSSSSPLTQEHPLCGVQGNQEDEILTFLKEKKILVLFNTKFGNTRDDVIKRVLAPENGF